MHAYVYGCVCASIILFETSRCCCWDFLSVFRYACTCMCICVCMHACICACVYMYAYTCICTRVWVYICTRVGAFFLFVLSNPSTTCACITGVFSTPACVCSGGLEVGFFFFTLFLVSACCLRWRLCFDRGRDRVLSCIFWHNPCVLHGISGFTLQHHSLPKVSLFL